MPNTKTNRSVSKTVKRTKATSKKATRSKKLNFKRSRFFPGGIFILLFAIVGAWFLIRSMAAPPTPDGRSVPDQILVRFRPGARGQVQSDLKARYKMEEINNLNQIDVKVFRVNPKAKDAIIKALSHNPNIDFAEPDYYVAPTATTPNDPEWSRQWGALMIEANKVWDITKGSSNVTVAVLDSGIKTGLADMSSRIVPGYDFVNSDNDPNDDHGHGTQITSVIGADTNNAIGIAGYDWNAKIMPIKVLSSSGTGTDSALIAGITYAADHDAKVVSMSLGGSSASTALDSAISYARSKNVLVVAAAGNNACDCKFYPAASPGVISVGASDQLDTLYSYSDFGPSWVKVAAPGSNPSIQTVGTYYAVGGTSSATPVVSATVSLLMAAKPTATLAEIETALYNNTDPVVGTRQVQYGRINAFKAMTALLGTTPPPADTTKPTTSITTPGSGTTVNGTIVVAGTATDNVGVTKVELYRNGVLYATDTLSPYSFAWDTTTVANGSYSLSLKAYDAAGNSGTSTTVTVTVNNQVGDTTPPSATLQSPTNGASVSGTVTASVSSSDNAGVVSTELYVDGQLRSSAAAGSFSYAWNTAQETNGSHTLVAKAYDAAGNVGTSATATVTVSNVVEKTAPVATIVSPTNGLVIPDSSTTMTISATATDNVGVTLSELYINGKRTSSATSTTGSLSYAWNTRKLKTGIYTLEVKAYDAAGNVGTHKIVVSK